MSTIHVEVKPDLKPPHGLEQIIATFGDIFASLRPDHSLDPRWELDSWRKLHVRFPSPSLGIARGGSSASGATYFCG